jgi:hypothetical protein
LLNLNLSESYTTKSRKNTEPTIYTESMLKGSQLSSTGQV